MCVPTYTLDVSCVPDRALPPSVSDPVIKPVVDIPFEGRVFFLYTPVDLHFLHPDYSVVVLRYFKPEMTPILSRVSGILSAFGGILSHGAILAREYKKGYVLVDDAPNRFFFGDYVRYSDRALRREETYFFTSGEPPYPTERNYSNYLYRYTLALAADSILLLLLERRHKFINLFGETYAINIPPSAYYALLRNKKNTLREKLSTLHKLDVRTDELEHLILLHVLQRASFAIIDSPVFKKFEKELVFEDFKTREFYSEHMKDLEPEEIVESIFRAKNNLFSTLFH